MKLNLLHVKHILLIALFLGTLAAGPRPKLGIPIFIGPPVGAYDLYFPFAPVEVAP